MVDILLATYNGEKYIEEQLDSLLLQTYKDIRIIVRDDNSTDGTMDILCKYQRRYPEVIHIVDAKSVSGSGAIFNFMKLVSYSTSDYVMFCDQDDYWLPRKVELTLKRMKQIEEKLGTTDIPVLVYTDYRVVDEELNDMCVKEKHMHTYGHHTRFNRLLVQNYVTGCTMMLNRALWKGIETTYNEDIIMHDWWIALYAAAFGKIHHISKESMLYRQHGSNVYGAVSIDSLSYIDKQRKMDKKENIMNKYYRQAKQFKNYFGDKLAENSNITKQLDEFIDIPNYSKPVRCAKLIKGGYMKGKLIMKLGQIVKA